MSLSESVCGEDLLEDSLWFIPGQHSLAFPLSQDSAHLSDAHLGRYTRPLEVVASYPMGPRTPILNLTWDLPEHFPPQASLSLSTIWLFAMEPPMPP